MNKTDKMDLTYNAEFLLKQRYLVKDELGNIIETPEQMCRRVAKTMASIDVLYGKSVEQAHLFEEQMYNLILQKKFLPNSPTLMNAGRPLGLLSACFVLPIKDDMEAIADAIKWLMLIQKAGGGTGFSFSRLRPEGDYVKSTGGTSSGPMSFAKAMNAVTDVIKQGGKRRGANMGVIRVDHPDIGLFIYAKMVEDGTLTNFNLSVGITDKFMKAVEEDTTYDLINPHTGNVVGKYPARMIWQHICGLSWMNGEPAVVFLDRMNAANPTPALGQFETTNPCGEVPLLPFESCNLGSINLGKFVVDGKIEWTELSNTVNLAVHFLDNVIDANKYPIPQIEEMSKGNRKIGLGVMGWADMLIKLGIRYDSEEAIELAEKVMSTIQATAKTASHILACERGSFPNFDKSIYAGGEPMRNATVTSIAPTGTIGIIADASNGIEPVFSIVTQRNVQGTIGKTLLEVNPAVKDILKQKGYWEGVKKALASGCIKCVVIPQSVKELVPTAQDIAPEWHVMMQAAFQKYVDNSISKTVNLPNSASVEDIMNIYQEAYKMGCKGITVYRDGSRMFQLLETSAGSCPTCDKA